MVVRHLKVQSLKAALTAVLALSVWGCAPEQTTSSLYTCQTITGTPWTPNVTGASASNHDAAVTVSETTHTGSGTVVGFAQAFQYVTFNFTVGSDLGTHGSFTLEATPTALPSGVSLVYPVLASLVDPNGKEWINLAASCATSGPYASTGSANSSCKPSWPSAYFSRSHWLGRQISIGDNGPSTNVFPTCNWAGGDTPGSGNNAACAFNSDFFVTGKVPTGTYTAKYVMMAGDASSLAGKTGAMSLKVVRKTDAAADGAIDINVVLVGDTNVLASRTAKGQANLDLLVNAMADLYAPSGSGVKIGEVRAIEWSCNDGGEPYAGVSTSQLADLYTTGGSLLPASAKTRSINLYLIHQFADGAGYLGIAGALGGPLTGDTGNSGVAIATFGKLETFNPNCSVSSCPLSSQEADFVDMGATMAHEMGHYLGLNHPSESSGATHDAVYDTPTCSTTNTYGYISINSCRILDTTSYPGTATKCSDVCVGYSATSGIFCETRPECQFNHLMWWSSKNFKNGSGDGNLISTNSRAIIDYHPLIQ